MVEEEGGREREFAELFQSQKATDRSPKHHCHHYCHHRNSRSRKWPSHTVLGLFRCRISKLCLVVVFAMVHLYSNQMAAPIIPPRTQIPPPSATRHIVGAPKEAAPAEAPLVLVDVVAAAAAEVSVPFGKVPLITIVFVPFTGPTCTTLLFSSRRFPSRSIHRDRSSCRYRRTHTLNTSDTDMSRGVFRSCWRVRTRWFGCGSCMDANMGSCRRHRPIVPGR